MKKFYVIVRKDLSHSQRAVQGGHAIQQYLLEHPNVEWNNGPLIFLGVYNEYQLKKWYDKLINKDIKCSHFLEPDIGYQMTALAAIDTGETFKQLRLI